MEHALLYPAPHCLQGMEEAVRVPALPATTAQFRTSATAMRIARLAATKYPV
jgi:hypothetical protein